MAPLTIKPTTSTSTTLHLKSNILIHHSKKPSGTSPFIRKSSSAKYQRFTHSQNLKLVKKVTTEQSLSNKQWRVPLQCSGENLRDEKLRLYTAGTEATEGLLELEADDSGWALEDDDSSINVTIHSKYIDKWDLKIYRVKVGTIYHLNRINVLRHNGLWSNEEQEGL
jgi:hypothetical protein